VVPLTIGECKPLLKINTKQKRADVKRVGMEEGAVAKGGLHLGTVPRYLDYRVKIVLRSTRTYVRIIRLIIIG
jgi:hypothetical protein